MKKSLSINLFLIIAAMVIIGCTTPNPDYKPLPASQDPTTNPQYTPNTTAISNAAYLAHQANNATAPINPYSVPANLLIDGVAALVTGASLVTAKIKSNQAAAAAATAAKKDSALNTMAAGVVRAGPTAIAAVTDHASNTPDFAHIANVINENSPA